MIIKAVRILTCSLLIPVFASGGDVRAHTLEKDGGISAVLRIPPDDAPVAGQSSDLIFEFQSDDPNFDAGECGCNVTIEQSGNGVTDVPLSAENKSSGVATVEFEESGAYEISVRGKSAGEQFRLTFSQRVTGGPASADSQNNAAGIQILMISAASLVILGLVARKNIVSSKRYSVINKKEAASDPFFYLETT